MSTTILGPLVEPGYGRDGVRDYFANMPLGNDPDYVYKFKDFVNTDDYNTSNFTRTSIDGDTDNAAVCAVSASLANGQFVLTTNDKSGDSESLQEKSELYEFVAGKKIWMETSLNLTSVTSVNFQIGFAITDTTPKDASDKVMFRCSSGDASIICDTTKNSTTTSVDSQYDMVATSNRKLGFYWNGLDTIYFYVDRVLVSEQTTNIPDDEQLALTIHLDTGAAGAKTATIDYIFIIKQR